MVVPPFWKLLKRKNSSIWRIFRWNSYLGPTLTWRSICRSASNRSRFSFVRNVTCCSCRFLQEENVSLRNSLEGTTTDLSGQLRSAREALAVRTRELDALRNEGGSRLAELNNKHAHVLNEEREKALQVYIKMWLAVLLYYDISPCRFKPLYSTRTSERRRSWSLHI